MTEDKTLEHVIQDIEHIILSRGAHEKLVFFDVKNIQEKKSFSEGDCPFCGGEKKFRISSERPFSRCWRASCEWGDKWHNWYEYIQASGSSLSWMDFYKGLAREAGVEWPEMGEKASKAYQSKVKRKELLEDAFTLCREELSAESGAAVKAYYESRGYTGQDIANMDLGAYPGQAKLSQALRAAGYEDKEIQEADLLSGKWSSHPALYLYPDKTGRALGLMGRAINGRIEPKYLYSKGLARSQTLPGLTKARGAEELLIIESPLGAVWLNSRSFSWPVVAIGGAELSKDQLEAIKQAGIRRVILALDMDTAGQKATNRTIELLHSAGLERLLVASWSGEKAPDDLAIAQGLQALETAVSSAERSSSWLARYIVSQRMDSGALEEERILAKAGEAYRDLDDNLERSDFLESLSQSMDLSPELLFPRLDKAEEEAKKKREKDLAMAGLRAAEDKLQAGDLAGYKKILRESLQTAEEARIELPEPHSLAELEEAIIKTPDSLSLGFSGLDPYVSVPRAALSVIAGGTGQGKTTLMLNLLARWSSWKKHEEESFYFFSYEEPWEHIALKLIIIWSGVELSPEQNFQAYKNYFKNHRGENEAIEQAIHKYEQLSRSGRLIIDDTMPYAEDLATTIGKLGKSGKVGAVIVDYIQRVNLARPLGTRYLDLAFSSNLLTRTASAQGLAIVVGSQLNPAGEVRESRDIENEAALVLKLIQEEGGPLSLHVAKQRAGLAGVGTSITFHKSILKMEDLTTSQAPAKRDSLSLMGDINK